MLGRPACSVPMFLLVLLFQAPCFYLILVKSTKQCNIDQHCNIESANNSGNFDAPSIVKSPIFPSLSATPRHTMERRCPSRNAHRAGATFADGEKTSVPKSQKYGCRMEGGHSWLSCFVFQKITFLFYKVKHFFHHLFSKAMAFVAMLNNRS